MKKPIWFVAAPAVLLTALALAQGVTAGMSLKVNGKDVAGKTIVQGGQAYVPVSALKAAGAVTSVNGKVLSVTFPTGGANQAGAVEGKVGEWLINGVWRFKVHSFEPLEGDRAGWTVSVELRNATKTDGLALAGTGFESLDLVLKDANKLSPYNISDIRDAPVNQAAGINLNIVFFDDQGGARQPDKLILRIKPDSATVGYLKSVGVAYTVKDPSFRVQLSEE